VGRDFTFPHPDNPLLHPTRHILRAAHTHASKKQKGVTRQTEGGGAFFERRVERGKRRVEATGARGEAIFLRGGLLEWRMERGEWRMAAGPLLAQGTCEKLHGV